MRIYLGVIIGICILWVSCSKDPKLKQNLQVNGHWIMEPDGQVMLNSQISGLAKWRDGLLTLSDRSADPSQRLRLRAITKNKAQLSGPDLPMILSEELQTSCFAAYITGNPDLEALVVDPDDDTVFYMVTEDASYAAPMSEGLPTKISTFRLHKLSKAAC